MRVAILATDTDSYEKPIAQGLQRMLGKIGVPATIFWKGHAILESIHPRMQFTGGGFRDQYHNLIKLPAVVRLACYDVIVLVSTIPAAYMRAHHGFIETLRLIFPRKPIVLYDTFYLPTRGEAYRKIKDDDPRNFGLERYDYYLAAGVVSEFPMPPGDHPVSVIGLNLEDASLRVEPKSEFVALLDFERPQQMRERAIMIQALEDTQTPYVVLNGHYPTERIRSIYRSVGAYFPAHRESFGLPIAELQLCGACVLTPYANWTPSYWIKKDLTVRGPGTLPDTFVVYANRLDVLVQKLREIKERHDPHTVAAAFVKHYPQYYYGDLEALSAFVKNTESGAIHGRSHVGYARLNRLMEWV